MRAFLLVMADWHNWSNSGPWVVVAGPGWGCPLVASGTAAPPHTGCVKSRRKSQPWFWPRGVNSLCGKVAAAVVVPPEAYQELQGEQNRTEQIQVRPPRPHPSLPPKHTPDPALFWQVPHKEAPFSFANSLLGRIHRSFRYLTTQV